MKNRPAPSINPFHDEVSANAWGALGVTLSISPFYILRISVDLTDFAIILSYIGFLMLIIASTSLIKGAPKRPYRTATGARAGCEMLGIGYFAFALVSPGMKIFLL